MDIVYENGNQQNMPNQDFHSSPFKYITVHPKVNKRLQ